VRARSVSRSCGPRDADDLQRRARQFFAGPNSFDHEQSFALSRLSPREVTRQRQDAHRFSPSRCIIA
jgi:hypothetical protein